MASAVSLWRFGEEKKASLKLPSNDPQLTSKFSRRLRAIRQQAMRLREIPPSFRDMVPFEQKLTHLGILITVLATVGFLWEIFPTMAIALSDRSYRSAIEVTVYVLFVGFLIYGNLVYQFARIGYLKRLALHRRATDDELRPMYEGGVPALTFLIPSYKEEARVIRQALLSAALQEYPRREVVLLIDDTVNPEEQAVPDSLQQSRALPHEIESLLKGPQEQYGRVLQDCLERRCRGHLDLKTEYLRLVDHYKEVASWFEAQAKDETIKDHTDALFTKEILRARALKHRAHAEDLLRLAKHLPLMPHDLAEARVFHECHRLASLFAVKLSSFERKRYRNLSHEPNKAMNLNSYIGLMGKGLQEVERGDGLYLEEAARYECTVRMADAPYIITLDADSLLLPEYALRLIYILEAQGNERMAVIQTPYSAVPNPRREIERIAGATTDIQYLIHQGFTQYGATFWVGANAVLRKAALEDVATTEHMNGYPIRKYIQDRTLIEDTDSTIDLIAKGWKLYNYPERLSYSATPPDFGSLLIQRGRWANGGLLILPKLITYVFAKPRLLAKFREGFFRSYYLTSLAVVSTAYIMILVWPYSLELNTWWLPITGLPYYLLYMRDLDRSGYQKKGDVLRVYALNLLLAPVHLFGTLKSLRQAWNGTKSVFARTPKVQERTSTPARYIVLECCFLCWFVTGIALDFSHRHWMDGAFALGNGGLLCYGIWRFIGFREALMDVSLACKRLLKHPR